MAYCEKSPLKIRSCVLTGDPALDATDPEWLKRAGSRAQLWAAGFKKEDFGKPIVTVAAPYMSIQMVRDAADGEDGGEREEGERK